MTGPADGYDAYYQARLWESLPALYRDLDTATFAGINAGTLTELDADGTGTGPLRELVNRIGTQIAVLRRSIDGLWADQSIETCADWLIPYIGDLVAARLVAGLDARGQRLDVANTIAWRRKKGTVTTALAVARDITGWDAHVVEAFRRLARTRHNLDPPVGAPPARHRQPSGQRLLVAEGLIEPVTRTPAGGFADLRSAPGALLTTGPFGQVFHHADLRRGTGTTGWHGAEKLVVHCWRLQSLQVIDGTPVPVSGGAGEYAFDPTGREIPLFLPPPDTAASTGTTQPWQVQGRLTSALLAVMAGAGVPPGYGVSGGTVAGVEPECGRFRLSAAPTAAIGVSYCYGFGGQIGAGSIDPAGPAPLSAAGETTAEGGTGLDGALAAAAAGGTITLTDSCTYTQVAAISVAPGGLTVRARPGQRPVIRLAENAQPWTFTGSPGARLVLDGLLVSGGDIVLQGTFDQVTIVGCTLDPGTAGPDPGARGLARSVDGRHLAPTRLWIEGILQRLDVARCITGPIRTRRGGLAERVVITDSIVQGLRTGADAAITAGDLRDPALLYSQLAPGRAGPQRTRAEANPLSAFIWRSVGGGIASRDRRQLQAGQPGAAAARSLATALSRLIDSGPIYRPELFEGIALSPRARRGGPGPWRNRLLLEDAYPLALGPAAVAVADADVTLNRVTVLGRLAARRLHATDSIMHGFAVVDDTENGCVRYSAALAGSRLPARERSLEVSEGGALFTSTAFGQPGYGQLLEVAERAVAAAAPGATLLGGGSSGGQMGAFAAEITPIKDRALRVKYGEYLPVGLTPVIVHVT